MKIKMTMEYELRKYNDLTMRYIPLNVKRNQILEVETIEEYTGKYTHQNTMKLYTLTFSDGRYVRLTDSLFEVVD